MLIAQRARRWTVPPALAVSIVLLAALPAAAAPPYAAWTTTTASPPAVGFPGATIATSTPAPTLTTPTGAATFLAPNTPFGAVYGSSQSQPYLNVATTINSVARSVTLTFTEPTPVSGWGFALGDLDSETVVVSATGPGGPVAGQDLGLQSTFNFCATGITPRASVCAGTFRTDVSGTIIGATSVTTTGNPGNPGAIPPVPFGANTIGSAAWFQPIVALTSLTLVIDDISGSPLYHLWIASLTAQASGTVTTPDPQGAPIPVEGATVTVADDAGVPVLTDPTDPASPPVSTTTDPAGAFTVPDLFPGDGADFSGTYNLVVTPPVDQPLLTPQTVPVDVSAGDLADLSVVLVEAVVPPAPPDLPPHVLPPPAAPPAGSAPQLSATGASVGTPLGLGTLLILTGIAVCWTARRRPLRHQYDLADRAVMPKRP